MFATYKLLAEIDILVRAKYVVCTFTSNICRFVQLLKTGLLDHVLSVDDEWIAE
jgi:hypothetical protein